MGEDAERGVAVQQLFDLKAARRDLEGEVGAERVDRDAETRGRLRARLEDHRNAWHQKGGPPGGVGAQGTVTG